MHLRDLLYTKDYEINLVSLVLGGERSDICVVKDPFELQRPAAFCQTGHDQPVPF